MYAYKRKKAARYLVYIVDPVFVYAQPGLGADKEFSKSGFFAEAEQVWNEQTCKFDALVQADDSFSGFIPVGKLRRFTAPEDLATEEFTEWQKENYIHISREDIEAAAKKLSELQERNDSLDRFDKIIEPWVFDDIRTRPTLF